LRVVTVGDKGKGDAELYDAQVVKAEAWWAKEYAPKLVKTKFVPSSLQFML
jgi:fatty acid synthase subunit beta